MRGLIQLGLFALLLHTTGAQAQPDLSAILRKVSEKYKASSRYEFEIDATGHEGANGARSTFHTHIAFRAPDGYRIDGAIPGLRVQDTDLSDAIMIHDGSTLWFYLPKSNQYASIPAAALSANGAGDSGDMRPEAVDHFLMWRYRSAGDFVKSAKFLREESIEIAGTKVACFVVTVSPTNLGLEYTWWVDKQTYRIVREDDAGNSAVFTSIRLNEPIRDELFKFEPPPGARKMETQ
jgi:outer membrane lipoprotein-sorting protein